MEKFFQEKFDIELKTLQLSTMGWNWGELKMEPSSLTFLVGGERAFQIPYSDISRSQIHSNIGSSKNDVTLEFHQDDTTDDNALSEIRFFIPNTEDEESEKTSAQKFHSKILSKADIVSTIGKGLIELKDMPILTPRGKYNIEMYSSFMKLHGKSFDYKILYTHISLLFELPHPNGRHVLFVVSLDPPIKQGQTRYPHIVLQFTRDEPLSVTFNVKEDKLKDKFGDLIDKKKYGHEDISKIFKLFTGKKITYPSNFKRFS